MFGDDGAPASKPKAVAAHEPRRAPAAVAAPAAAAIPANVHPSWAAKQAQKAKAAAMANVKSTKITFGDDSD